MILPFNNLKRQIAGLKEEGIKNALLIVDRTNLLTTEEKNELRSLCAVRRNILEFDKMPNIPTKSEPTPYVHSFPKEKIPIKFQKPMECCTYSLCPYKCVRTFKK